MSKNKILELLERKNITFIEKGDDALICCINPEHQDSSPSMRINKTNGKYHCFACGFGGASIFDYFNEYYNPITRRARELQSQIANMLVDLKGIDIPDAAEFYLGDHRGIPPRIYAEFKAFQHPDYEDRLCFPIYDLNGRVTNIVGRNMHTNIPPKYKVFPEGRGLPIYPHVKAQYVILVEGIYDVLNLKTHGIENVACLFGTQSISHKVLLNKITPLMLSGVQDVFILLDNDKAGNNAAEYLRKGIEYQTNLRVHIFNGYLPEGKDPGELTFEEAAEVYKHIRNVLDS